MYDSLPRFIEMTEQQQSMDTGEEQCEEASTSVTQEQCQQNGETAESKTTEPSQNDGEIETAECITEPSVPSKTSEGERTLYIGGINSSIQSEDLKEYFGKFGEVSKASIKTDTSTGKFHGFGFVIFSSQEAIGSVLKNGPHTIKGKQVNPEKAKPKPVNKKVFVGGLEADVPEVDIRSYFEKFGKIEAIELPFDKMKNQRRKFCFVTFETKTAADEACKKPKQKIGNKVCNIKKVIPKPEARSRGGFRAYSRAPRGYGQNRRLGAQGYRDYGEGYIDYNQDYGYQNYMGDYGYDFSQDEDERQQSSYGKFRRGGAAKGYHPYGF